MSIRLKGLRKLPLRISLLVRTVCFHCRGVDLIPGAGTKIPQVVQCKQTKKIQLPLQTLGGKLI